MVSVGAMVKQLSGMLGTDDLTDWEKGFVQNIDERSDNGKHTLLLTDNQTEIIERLWSKHFA
jgi:hypothetical protein